MIIHVDVEIASYKEFVSCSHSNRQETNEFGKKDRFVLQKGDDAGERQMLKTESFE